MHLFNINNVHDWKRVAAYLMDHATQPQDNIAVALHLESGMAISLALSIESADDPPVLHLSMVQIVPNLKPGLAWLDDAVAQEAATHILHTHWEIKRDGTVRHFFRGLH